MLFQVIAMFMGFVPNLLSPVFYLALHKRSAKPLTQLCRTFAWRRVGLDRTRLNKIYGCVKQTILVHFCLVLASAALATRAMQVEKDRHRM